MLVLAAAVAPGMKQVDICSCGSDLPLSTAPRDSKRTKKIVTGTIQITNDTAKTAEAVPDWKG